MNKIIINSLFCTLIILASFINDKIVSADILQDIKKGDIASVRKYIEDGGNVNATGGQFRECLINNAIMFGKYEIVKLLVENGADVHSQTGIGDYTPLARAVNYSDFKSVKLLVEKGADVNKKTGGSFFRTPLTLSFSTNWAASGGDSYPIFLYLLNKGADINIRDGLDHTVINYAIINSCEKCLHELLKRGANPNIKSFGRTPLEESIKQVPIISNFSLKEHDSMVNDSIYQIELLLKFGAKTDISSKDGKTIEDVINKKFKDYVTTISIEDLKIKKNKSKIPVVEGIKITKTDTPESGRDKYYKRKRIEILNLIKKYRKK